MNLKEQQNRVKRVMGILSEALSDRHKRRIYYVGKILESVLKNSTPCDYRYFTDYIENLIYVTKFVLEYGVEVTDSNISALDADKIIKEYFIYDVEKYFLEKTKNC